MMEALKNIGKGAIVLGIVGVLLALAAEPIASVIGVKLLGEAGMAAAAQVALAPLWTGAFFGAFGALHAAVAPVMDWVFGDKKEVVAAAPARGASCTGYGHGVNITNLQMQPELNIAADVDVDAKANLVGGNENIVDNKAKLFAKAIEGERVNAPNLRLVK
jgi:hypothetical protein